MNCSSEKQIRIGELSYVFCTTRNIPLLFLHSRIKAGQRSKCNPKLESQRKRKCLVREKKFSIKAPSEAREQDGELGCTFISQIGTSAARPEIKAVP